MRSSLAAVVVILLALPGSVPGQGAPMAFTSVGTPQSVPSPPGTGGSTGFADMAGFWDNQTGQRRLSLRLRYISPMGYVSSGYAPERVFFGYNFGSSALPGVMSLGSRVYLPLSPPIGVINLGPVTWNGPGDTVPPTSSGGTGLPCPFPIGGENCSFGKSFTFTLGPAFSGVPITAQYFLWDPGAGRAYSSNALNMVAP